jgi:uncharacterized protein involved in exopolysaccharide biosynthesis
MYGIKETGRETCGNGRIIVEENKITENSEDEISLIDLFAVLWQRKKMIIPITVIAALLVVAVSIVSLKLPPEHGFLPNEYTPQALMLINNSGSSGGGILNSRGLGSLASFAGISVPGGQTYSELAQYLVGTNTLLDSVVDKFDLVKRYKIKLSPRAASRAALKKKLTAGFDEDSGVFSIGFTDYDPVFAREVVNYCVDYLGNWFKELGLDKNVLQKANLEQNIQNTFNEIRRLEEESHNLERSVSTAYGSGAGSSIMLETQRIALELQAQQEVYKQLKVQLELTNVTIASETPIFQILEMAEVPDRKSKPSRGMLCIIVTFAAFFFSVFLAFILNAVENIKKDPEAMAKLRTKGKVDEQLNP